MIYLVIPDKYLQKNNIDNLIAPSSNMQNKTTKNYIKYQKYIIKKDKLDEWNILFNQLPDDMKKEIRLHAITQNKLIFSSKFIKFLLNKMNQKIKEFKGHREYIKSIQFSPDSKYFLTGSKDHTSKFWKISNAVSKPLTDPLTTTNNYSQIKDDASVMHTFTGSSKHRKKPL